MLARKYCKNAGPVRDTHVKPVRVLAQSVVVLLDEVPADLILGVSLWCLG